jgi:pyruvate dehydrogenase E1 component alpha subunit
MMLIRTVEARLIARRDHGFQLYSSGEEAVAVGVCAAILPGDQLLSSGRAIGPALARGLDSAAVIAELLGKSTGTNRGKAGRGHIAQPEAGFFGAHTVVAGNLSIAAGAALACQRAATGAIVATIFGDGACGAGALHEALNIAALWRLPLLFVCNNNGLSVSTPVAQTFAPQPLSGVAAPFGILHATVDGMDVAAVREATAQFAAHARGGAGPAFLECRSERFMSHSSATRETRSPEEMEFIRARCPIARLARELEAAGVLDAPAFAALEREVEAEVARGFDLADAAPFPDREEALRDVG